MPKQMRQYPINLNLRIGISQRDFLDEMASLHGCAPSVFLRGLIDNARVDRATSTIDRVTAPANRRI